MSPIRRLFSRSSVPRGLLGMLVLVVLVESFLGNDERGFTGDRAADWEDQGRSITRPTSPGEILCFGDSLVKFGLVPKVLEERLGKPARNHALIGGQPDASYFLLKHALDAGSKPSAVVVDFHAFLIAETPYFNVFNLPFVASTLECLDLARTMHDPSIFGSTLLARPLASVRSRFEIRTGIQQALNADPNPMSARTRDWVKFTRRNWTLNEGAMIMGKNPQFHGSIANFYQPIAPADWKCDPTNKRYIRRFLDLAAAHHVPVFWLIPPYCSQAQAERDRVGAHAVYDNFVNQMQSKCPNVVVIDGRRVGYEDSLFFDPIHLDRDGAVLMSNAVAEAIRPYLADQPDPMARHWVDLPRGRGTNPPGLVLEDVVQSGAAVAAQRLEGKVVR